MTEELDKLAFEFFKLFARYEYALKVMKYTKTENGPAEANWDKFSNEIGCNIFTIDKDELKVAIKYLFDQPPKKQIVKNGELDWEHVNGSDTSPQALFSHIRRVRNNLYHGGKFNGRWFAPERSKELISHSLTVLYELKKANRLLKKAIDNSS